MKTNTRNWTIAGLALALAAAAGGWWYAKAQAPHRHTLVQATDEQGKAYWTCPMHPQVRQQQPGNCPICGMKLVKREDPPADAGTGGDREVLYWYDPMKPDVHFDAPGKSPFMDMQLLPRYGSAAGAADGTIVQIDPRMAQNLGMRTAPIKTGTFWQRVDTVGAVGVDEHRIVAVEARAAGWVERLDVRAEGDPVEKGQRVAALYSPELYAAMQELNLARDSGDTVLIDAAEQRLRLLGGTPGSGTTTPVRAPLSGYVMSLAVREGAQVVPGTPLMKLADLSRVWVQVEVPEAQAAWVREGRSAQARFKSLPGQVFEGTVDYVYPLLDIATRTVRLRLVFDNPDGLLKPGMYADVTVYGGARRDVLLAPTEAVIRTGTRNVVIVDEGEGRYRPVEVESGPERSGEIVILSGLDAGARVVVSGQFLIDSEASLLGAYRRMSAPDNGEGP
ncbi:MAG: efflux RND transporter periplasmic adaptor subunit [Pseudomonadota bacterium]|nr:efflux RND transporter periplasmic adaptor subunit [Pseudomonadota bacterium]